MPTQTTTPEVLDFLGSKARILVDGDGTAGRFALVDMQQVPARSMPPLHVHHNEDEGFYVLAGEVTLHLPGESIACSPGDYVVAPRGVPHAYEVGDSPARWMVTSNPAGFERFVIAVAGLDAVDPDTLAAVAGEHDIEILGPPGTRP
jgi:mannose-6-phosphate isomerase-like protein (cupin superfamily)